MSPVPCTCLQQYRNFLHGKHLGITDKQSLDLCPSLPWVWTTSPVQQEPLCNRDDPTCLCKTPVPPRFYTGTKWGSISLLQFFILQTWLCSSDTFPLALKVWKYKGLVVINLNLYFSANRFQWYLLHCGLSSDIIVLGMSHLVKKIMEYTAGCFIAGTSRKLGK